MEAHRPLMGPQEFELMTPVEFANVAGQSPVTVARWRRSGDGPAYLKLGRKIAYRRVDIQTWLDQQRVKNTAEHRARSKAA